MKKKLIILFSLLLLCSCGTENKEYQYNQSCHWIKEDSKESHEFINGVCPKCGIKYEESERCYTYLKIDYPTYLMTESSDAVSVEGIITYIAERVSASLLSSTKEYVLDLQDSTGAYFIYGITEEDYNTLNLSIGVSVRIYGTIDITGSRKEIRPNSIRVLDTNINKINPINITNEFENIDAAKLETINNKYYSSYVLIENCTITDTSQNTIVLEKNDFEFSIEFSNYFKSLSSEEETNLINTCDNKIGSEVNINGIYCISNNNFYLSLPTADSIVFK